MVDIIHFKYTYMPPEGAYRNALVINDDYWNDYGYCTLFHVNFFDGNGSRIEIGTVKIYDNRLDIKKDSLSSNRVSDVLGERIIHLDETNFCSLGQSLNYYKKLKKCIPIAYMDVLDRLNDIAINISKRNRFINCDGVRVSLLRDSSAAKALKEAKQYLTYNQIDSNDVSFTFEARVPYSEYSSKIYFNFKKDENIPYRINILIGKNGTGKTHILTDLAETVSGLKEWESDLRYNDWLFNERPLIDKVISISYSAFDSFKKKPNMNNGFLGSNYFSSSYEYCGIQSVDGTLSIDELDNIFIESYQLVKIKNRIFAWDLLIQDLVGAEYNSIKAMAENNTVSQGYFSSGEHILICTITEVLAKIENESLILFDEPEIHLHPNAIASVMKMFYRLLEEFNSYAIFATHSPLIVQETPSRYIHVLERIENSLIVRHPELECFGENITNITDEIFDVNSSESNYKTILETVANKMTFEEALSLFDNKLSFNALIYLKNCYN